MLINHGAKGTRLSAISEDAERQGLYPDMRLNDARAMIPHLRVETHQPAWEMIFFKKLTSWMGRYSPSIGVYSAYNLVLDSAGCDHLFGGEEAMLEDIYARLTRFGFIAQLALADSLGAAYALAHFAAKPIYIMPSHSGSDVYDRLPVDALRLNEDTLLLLKRLGLKWIGDVRHIPRAALERRFYESQKIKAKRGAVQNAQSVSWRLDQLLGHIAEPISYLNEPSAFRVTKPCPELALEQGAVEIALDELLPKLSGDLAKAGKGARRFTLIGYRADGGASHASIMLSAASYETQPIIRLFKERLAEIECGFGIDLFVLEASFIEAVRQIQKPIIADEETRTLSPSLHQFADVVNNRVGAQSVQKFAPRTSYVPERAQMRVALSQKVNWLEWQEQAPHFAPRPLRLLERPEPASVTAELPDSPPAQFIWRKVLRRVIRARGPERILPEWWHDELKSKRSATFRDYYDVEDDQGLRYWIFRATKDDVIGDSDALMRLTEWFVHGLF